MCLGEELWAVHALTGLAALCHKKAQYNIQTTAPVPWLCAALGAPSSPLPFWNNPLLLGSYLSTPCWDSRLHPHRPQTTTCALSGSRFSLRMEEQGDKRAFKAPFYHHCKEYVTTQCTCPLWSMPCKHWPGLVVFQTSLNKNFFLRHLESLGLIELKRVCQSLTEHRHKILSEEQHKEKGWEQAGKKNSGTDWIFMLLQSWPKVRNSPQRVGEHPRLRNLRNPVCPRAHCVIFQTTQELLWAGGCWWYWGCDAPNPKSQALLSCFIAFRFVSFT